MHFEITEKPTTDCVSLYNYAGLISKVSEEIASENADNCRCQRPHCCLTPRPRGTSPNIRINLIQPETIVIELYFCCRQYGSIFIQIFVVGSERRMCFETECVMALQDHPRSSIFAPIESVYSTSYWSSIVTLVLSFRDIASFLRRATHFYSIRILVVSPLDQVTDVLAPRSENPKLITRAITTFELTQRIRPGYHNVTDGQTGRQPGGRLTIAIPRFALRASRCKKAKN